MRCSKCGSMPQQTDQFAWRCNSCKKAYRVSFKNIQSFAEKKKSGVAGSLLKCKECGVPLDDGNEMIVWKCSCGNMNMEKLKDFEEEVESFPERNLIKCPECGREVSDTITTCPQCGYEIITQDDVQEGKMVIPRYKNKKFIGGALWAFACICFIIAFTRINNDDYVFYKEHYQICMEGYAENKLAANAYTGGFFKNSYNNLASDYERMARSDNKKIWEYRIQAIILGLAGVACVIVGYKEYKKGWWQCH